MMHVPMRRIICIVPYSPSTATPRLGDAAPDSQVYSTEGPISFHAWLGTGWGVLFNHRDDFTWVCTTQLGDMARLKPEFDRRMVEVAALSLDPLERQRTRVDYVNQPQAVSVGLSLIADHDRTVAEPYGATRPNVSERATVRSLFIVRPDRKIKLMIACPASTGRKFTEILRMIDSLQLTAAYQYATQADWKPGEDVIIVPAFSDEEAASRIAHIRRVRPFLRCLEHPGR